MKISAKTKSVLKFEAKLLASTLVLSLIVYFGTLSFIYHAGHYVANVYTQGF